MIKRFNDERDSFFDNRFGLFVHWGIYAVGEWQEQHGYRKNIDRYEYAKFAEQFNPVKYKPADWVKMAIETGMDYMCFTTKHIDGFCMFDTKLTDFNIMNTPYGKDVLKELAEECHKRNFPLALYYSPIDRNHPDYPYYGGSYENQVPYPKDTPDLERYIDYIKGHVAELCSNYGKVYGLWWDGGRHMNYEDPSVNELVRKLQPDILINNRGFSDGDFRTPERDWDDYVNEDKAFETPTEACQSIGAESWGYRKDEDYYTPRHIMESIDKILSKGGNYLLNAGPMANGLFPKKAIEILGKIGSWYKKVRTSYIGAKPLTGVVENKDILLTIKKNKIYVHLYKYPNCSAVMLTPININPMRARLLNNGDIVETKVEITPWLHKENKPYLRLVNLPAEEFANEVMVVEMEFEERELDGFMNLNIVSHLI